MFGKKIHQYLSQRRQDEALSVKTGWRSTGMNARYVPSVFFINELYYILQVYFVNSIREVLFHTRI